MINNFDLSTYKLVSDRRVSKNYMSSDGKLFLKINKPIAPRTVKEYEIEKELTNMTLELGIKTSKCVDLVTTKEGELGILYEFIGGKESICRAIANDPANMETYAKIFADFAKDMHSKKCDTDKFDSMEFRIGEQIFKRDFLNKKQKEKALNVLGATEKKTTFIHGDFQPDNFLIADEGNFAVDLGMIAYGNPVFDLGIYYFLTHYLPDDMIKQLFHVDPELARKTWDTFAKFYYDINDDKLKTLNQDMKKISLVAIFGTFIQIKPGMEFPQILKTHFDEVFA